METVTVAGGRVVLRCGTQVRLDVSETIRPLRSDRRRRMRVLARVVISTGSRGGRVAVRMGEPVRRGCTAVLLGGRRPAVVTGELDLPTGRRGRARARRRRALTSDLIGFRAGRGPRRGRWRGPGSGAGLQVRAAVRGVAAARMSVSWRRSALRPSANLRPRRRRRRNCPPTWTSSRCRSWRRSAPSMPGTVPLGEVVVLRVRLTRGELRVRAGAHPRRAGGRRAARPAAVGRRCCGAGSSSPTATRPPETGTARSSCRPASRTARVVPSGCARPTPVPAEVQVVVRQDARRSPWRPCG